MEGTSASTFGVIEAGGSSSSELSIPACCTIKYQNRARIESITAVITSKLIPH
jgi:hypothetical protein